MDTLFFMLLGCLVVLLILPEQPRFCKDCKHYKTDGSCERPQKVNLVTGSIAYKCAMPWLEREDCGDADRCGKRGKYFKRKEK